MAAFNITPGLNKILGVNGVNSDPTSFCFLNTDGTSRDVTNGDVCTLLNGTYTFTTGQAIPFDIGLIGGAARSNIVVQGESQAGVILNIAGCTQDAIHGGDSPNHATNITIKNMTITGTPTGSVVRQNANSLMTGWTFENITLDAITKSFFDRLAATTGAGITFKNITTTSNYAGTYVIGMLGTNTNHDLKIDGVDARLHTNAMQRGVYLDDVRNARVYNVRVANPAASATFQSGIYVRSNDVAKGLLDVEIENCEVDGGGANTQPLIYGGNQSAYKVSQHIFIRGCTVSNSGSYGIELEGGVVDSEIVACRVTNCTTNGIPIPDSNQNILVADNVIDGVSGTFGAGVAVVCGQRHRVLRNTISNCAVAIRHDENGDVAQAPDGVNLMNNELNVIRGNIIMNVGHAYHVTTAAMPTDALANKFGPNTIYTPSVAFAQITAGGDSGNLATQANWETKYPESIEKSDTVITESSQGRYRGLSTEQCLNILAGNNVHPYNKYSAQEAANRLIGNTGAPRKYSLQNALNLALVP